MFNQVKAKLSSRHGWMLGSKSVLDSAAESGSKVAFETLLNAPVGNMSALEVRSGPLKSPVI